MTKHHIEDIESSKRFLIRHRSGTRVGYRLIRQYPFGDVVIEATEMREFRPGVNLHKRADSVLHQISGLSNAHRPFKEVVPIYDPETGSFKRYSRDKFVSSVLSREESCRG